MKTLIFADAHLDSSEPTDPSYDLIKRVIAKEKFDRIINMSELDDIYTDICREIDLKLSGLPVFQQFQIPLFSGWVGENGLILSTHTEPFYYENIRRLSKQAAESFITSAFQSRRVQTAYFE